MNRKAALASLVVIVPVGFYSKVYRGPGAYWVNTSLDGVFYEIFWCLFLALALSRARPQRIAIGVLTATCILEFLQLWHPPFLEAIRATFSGRAIIGTTFDWSDFPYYFIGSALGWFWLIQLRRKPGQAC
jgi:hypothetical protein